jgi:lipopolysaccharide biosynthesis regulator YciM
LKSLVGQSSSLTSEVTSLKTKNGELETQVASLTKMATVGTEYLKEVREQTVASYKKLYSEEDQDPNIVAVLENTDTSLQSLLSFKKSYDTQLNKNMPLKCSKCGSTDVSRAASLEDNTEPELVAKVAATQDIAKKLAKSKL